MKELNQSKITINDTTFVIGKLGAFKSFKLLEKIRVALAYSSNDVKNESTDINGFIKAILALPEELIDEVMEIFFDAVRFIKKDEVKGAGLPLEKQNYDMAFASLEPVHIYELLARCITINFFCSFQELQKRFPVFVSRLK